MLDALEEHLRNHQGSTKIPLAYVVRDDDEVAAEADDPAVNYLLVQDEMICRAPHHNGATPPS